MSDEIELVALGLIVLGTGQIENTGELRSDGALVLCATSREVRPGQRFRVNREFARTLLAGPKPFAAFPDSEAATYAVARLAAIGVDNGCR